ncbi:OmpA family protein [Pararhodonellum marinum]|uniref:OmpA family protein n=1 Tax=Pararhodonellum marinum TaxID=2755358 RepID=UPI00188E09BA|nr:OmpA family protein [Pararhodonellum marinum]
MKEKLTLLNKFQVKACILVVSAFFSLCSAYSQAYYLKAVNSAYDEQHPVFSPNGELYLTVAYHPNAIHGAYDPGDIWISTKNDFNQWQPAVPVSEMSTKGYDLMIGFLDPTNVLVYHDGKGRPQGVHQYIRKGSGWQYERKLDFGSFRNNSSHFSGRLDAAGNILVMAMNTFGSYGNEDIYVSFNKGNGTWTTPKNLGPTINTDMQELTPSLSKDTKVLYFSTNGHDSESGMDVFFSERLDETWDNWTQPVRLQDINSTGMEFAYHIDPNSPYTAYLTTTKDSEGYGDIIMQKAEEIVLVGEEVERRPMAIVRDNSSFTLSKTAPQATETNPSQVLKENTTQPPVETQQLEVPAEDPETFRLQVINKVNQETIPFQMRILMVSGDEVKSENYLSGIHAIDLPEGVQSLVISAPGFVPNKLQVNDTATGLSTLALVPAQKGATMVLDNILFERGTSQLADDDSRRFIRFLADFMSENPSLKVRLDGHTDNVGDAGLNKELSLDRAAAIRDILVEEGITFERVRISGWGGTRPITSNQTEAGRNSNRRVEMVIEE